jgi:sigma-B regulation protein RsbU (phosphoserine phosphatase)
MSRCECKPDRAQQLNNRGANDVIQVIERQHPLVCMEVWGGNRRVTRTVELPGLTAWVHCQPAGADDGGGDVHYLSLCGEAFLSRVVLADVSGHGVEVSAAAQVLQALMRESINSWDQTDFVRGLNQSFRGCVAKGRYATAVVLGILRDGGETAFTNAGHLPPLWYRSGSASWTWLDEEACREECAIEGLPVGLIPGTDYRQTVIQLEPADILVLYTDGITEAEDASGEMLGRDRLMEWTRAAPLDGPEAVGQFLLDRLGEFHKGNLIDDETIIAIQRGSYS